MTYRFPWQVRRDLTELPDALGTLAAHTEIRGHRNDADALREVSRALAAMAPRARGALLRELRDDPERARAMFGEASAAVLARLAAEGHHAVLRASLAHLPADLVRLLGLPGVTLDEVLDLHRRFGIVTAADLAAAVMLTGREPSDSAALSLHQRLLSFLPRLREGRPRMPLGRALGLAEEMRALVAEALPGEAPPAVVGSARRFEPTVGDVALLMTTASPAPTLSAVARALGPERTAHAGGRAITAVIRDEQVTMHVVGPDASAAASVCYTGAALHLALLRARAAERGWRLEPTGLAQPGSAHVETGLDEGALYERLGLQYVPPELRQGGDELSLAAEGRLPVLVERQDVRGDLHTHTLWSDGRDSVAGMAHAARALGYQYIAITDHSQSAAASRVLTLERLERQRDEVERARAAVPGIVILHGVEVDILSDGSREFPDQVHAELDLVLASLHDPNGQEPDRLLARYVAAMRHPLVSVITHPANRLVGRHEGYRIDFDELFRVAVETGTALEVDGGPGHLDLDGHLARRAVESGVTLVVDSDCHNAQRLGRQMQLGLGTARRGGVEARHVLNTRPLAEVLAFIARKRAGAGGSSSESRRSRR